MSKVIQNKGGYGMGSPYDLPGYEYDPVNDTFKDLTTGKTFTKDYVAPTPSSGGSGTPAVALEANKATTIDVSQYTEPVEIIPTPGKDAMEKVTVSLSNMPAGTFVLYGWQVANNSSPGTSRCCYLPVTDAPANDTEVRNMHRFSGNIETGDTYITAVMWSQDEIYTRVSDTEFTIQGSGGGIATYTRDYTKDVQLWD